MPVRPSPKRSSKSIENHFESNPYRVMFGSGGWTCTVARWKRRMIGPWTGLDGKVHDATGQTFELEFCTVARRHNGEIMEENLFYDHVGCLRQIGVL
jgi:SnoaL-like polyketide cyclase